MTTKPIHSAGQIAWCNLKQKAKNEPVFASMIAQIKTHPSFDALNVGYLLVTFYKPHNGFNATKQVGKMKALKEILELLDLIEFKRIHYARLQQTLRAEENREERKYRETRERINARRARSQANRIRNVQSVHTGSDQRV